MNIHDEERAAHYRQAGQNRAEWFYRQFEEIHPTGGAEPRVVIRPDPDQYGYDQASRLVTLCAQEIYQQDDAPRILYVGIRDVLRTLSIAWDELPGADVGYYELMAWLAEDYDHGEWLWERIEERAIVIPDDYPGSVRLYDESVTFAVKAVQEGWYAQIADILRTVILESLHWDELTYLFWYGEDDVDSTAYLDLME